MGRAINWQDVDWSAPNTAIADQLGVTEAAVRKQRKRAGIEPACQPGRPPNPLPLVELTPPLRLEAAELQILDAFASVVGMSRADALRRLVRSARAALPGGGRDARVRFDGALNRLRGGRGGAA
ncbi:MAG: hypothetical protein AB7K09_22925 [Planctomycetota bacterium]